MKKRGKGWGIGGRGGGDALQTCPPQGLTLLQHFKNVFKVMC
jgi:hypothetical protein